MSSLLHVPRKNEIQIWGHSKSTFAQDSRVLTPPLPLLPYLHLFVFKHLHPPNGTFDFTFVQNSPSPRQFLYLRNLEKKYLWLNSTCLLRSHSGFSIKWTLLVHNKSVCFIEMSTLSKVHLKSEVFKSKHEIHSLS